MKYAAERLKLLEKILLKAGASFAGVAFLESRGCEPRPEMLAKYGSADLLGVLAFQSRTATN